MKPDYLVRTRKQLVWHARRLYRNRDYAGSLEQWELLLSRDPDHAMALVGRFDCLLKLERRDEALEAGARACEFNPDSTPTVNNYACLLMDNKAFDQAAGFFVRAAELDPTRNLFRFNAGVAYFNAGDYDRAEGFLRQTLADDPAHDRAMEFLSRIYLACGRLDDVIELGDRLELIKPGHSLAGQRRLYCQQVQAPLTATECALEQDNWSQAVAARFRKAGSGQGSRPGAVNRVGFVLGDRALESALRLLPALKEGTAGRMELVGYGEGRLLERFPTLATQCLDRVLASENASLKSLYRTVRSHAPDVVVDLNGNAPDLLNLLYEHRVAPHQVAWDLVRPALASDSMDSRIGVPGPGLPYRPPWMADAAPSGIMGEPDEGGGHRARFGYTGPLANLDSGTVDAWSVILDRCPGSELVIASSGCDYQIGINHLHAKFGERGIAAYRLGLTAAPASPLDLQAFLQSLDMVLDPLLAGRGVCAIDPLYAGRPTIAQQGASPALDGLLGSPDIAMQLKQSPWENLLRPVVTGAEYVERAVWWFEAEPQRRELENWLLESSPGWADRAGSIAADTLF